MQKTMFGLCQATLDMGQVGKTAWILLQSEKQNFDEI